jgi:hypothetical protein
MFRNYALYWLQVALLYRWVPLDAVKFRLGIQHNYKGSALRALDFVVNILFVEKKIVVL